MCHPFNVNIILAACFDHIIRSSSGIYKLSSSNYKLLAKIRIHILAIGGVVASEYIFLYSEHRYFNKIHIKIMIK
jgi:hypothetical protein